MNILEIGTKKPESKKKKPMESGHNKPESEKDLFDNLEIIDLKEIQIRDKFIRINPNIQADKIRIELITGISFNDFLAKLDFGFIDNTKHKDGTYLVSYNHLSLLYDF